MVGANVFCSVQLSMIYGNNSEFAGFTGIMKDIIDLLRTFQIVLLGVLYWYLFSECKLSFYRKSNSHGDATFLIRVCP